MKRSFLLLISFCIIILISSCVDHIKKGDEYFRLASEAINNDSIIKAYSLIEKSIEEYNKGKDTNKEYKAKIFLSLLYFSTNQKEQAYDIIKDIKTVLTDPEDYPLYSNYYRIKAYYHSLSAKNPKKAVALIDSVLHYDSIYAKDKKIIAMDLLNKCEILLNSGDSSQVARNIDLVTKSIGLPATMEPQIYVNMARRFELAGAPDSAYKYAKLSVAKTTKMHEDIDNNLYAIDIILRYDSVNNNLSEYIKYRDILEKIMGERQGERIKYGMAFVKEQNRSEKFRLKAQEEKRTLIWIAVSVLLVSLSVSLFLWHRRKEAISHQRMIQLECDRLDAEAFRRKLENELLQRKINSKSDELMKANNEILELSQKLAQKKSTVANVDASYLQRLMDNLASDHPDFQQKLAKNYPDITKTEATLASLIKLNLSSEEITTAMSISKSGLIKARYRLRKKLGIESSSELDTFISQL